MSDLHFNASVKTVFNDNSIVYFDDVDYKKELPPLPPQLTIPIVNENDFYSQLKSFYIEEIEYPPPKSVFFIFGLKNTRKASRRLYFG